VWLVGLAVLVLLAAGGFVATRLADDDGPDRAGSPDTSAGSSPDTPQDPSGSATDGEESPAGPAEGAAALGSEPERSEAGVPVDEAPGTIVPDPAEGDQDLPDLYRDDCQLKVDESAIKDCAYGASEADARATIAVVGDSKAAQWLPALQILAERYSWRLEVYTKSACPPSTAAVSNQGEVYRTCSEFNRQVRKKLTEDPVDLVFTENGLRSAVSGRNRSGSLQVSPERLSEGLERTWRVWASVGSKVLVVSDTPKPVDPEDDRQIFDVPECVEDHPEQLTACTFDREKGVDLGGFRTQEAAFEQIGARNLTRALRDLPVGRRTSPDISYVNIIPWVCPTDTCPAVIGNVLVYRNGSHLTKTYVETLAPLLEKALLVIGREPAAPIRRPRR
jgi:hypothetical protein